MDKSLKDRVLRFGSGASIVAALLGQSNIANAKPAKPYAHIENQVFLEVPGGKPSILTPDKANANFSASIGVAMNDQHPDYASLLLGNYILGGSIDSSRLANRIRQREGLSYGVSSFFFVRADDQWAKLSMTASCNPSNIQKVETAVREELERLLRDGIPIGEFETAKEALLK